VLPLDGCKVLEVAMWRPAPYAGQLLQELGADVLKVEPPTGDPMRLYPRLFDEVAAGKRSIVCDLKVDADRARCVELAAGADVVLEGYRPGVAARLGVGPGQLRAVNPKLVYVSVSGLGATGPLALAPGHDVNYVAWSGALSHRSGAPPSDLPLPVADLSAGMAAALAAVAGWTRALRTGEGAFVDLAMTDVLATWAGLPGANVVDGAPAESATLPAYGIFPVVDGYVTVGVTAEDHFWDSLCRTLDLPDLLGITFAERQARGAELRPFVAAALAGRRRDELVAELLAADVPAAPVHTHADMAAWPHLLARGTVVDGPSFGPLLRFPGARTTPPPPPPKLDEHRGQGWNHVELGAATDHIG
jgi:crotonobetainyl-CoA:carnitine CoA-transferase CaiB-like acyl-CoA transferase